MTEFKSAALPETQLRYLPLSQVGDVSVTSRREITLPTSVMPKLVRTETPNRSANPGTIGRESTLRNA